MDSVPREDFRKRFLIRYLEALTRSLAGTLPGQEIDEVCQQIKPLAPTIYEANMAIIEDEMSQAHLRRPRLCLPVTAPYCPRWLRRNGSSPFLKLHSKSRSTPR